MNKPIKMIVAVFLALGSMISLTPREGRSREEPVMPEDYKQGIERHFVAVWNHLSNAVKLNEK